MTQQNDMPPSSGEQQPVDEKPKASALSARWPLFLTVGIVLIFAGIFLVEFIAATISTTTEYEETEITAQSYLNAVNPLIQMGDAARGADLIDELGCASCHIIGAGQIAPPFDGVAVRAGTRRPPLTPAAYLYESIAYPYRYVVDGYAPAMLNNYLDRLTQQQFADILVYLLRETA